MSDLNDRAGEEWESLRLMSFHGAPWDSADPPKSWLADMTREHVAKVADLINELASELRAAEARVVALERQIQDIGPFFVRDCARHVGLPDNTSMDEIMARVAALTQALQEAHDALNGLWVAFGNEFRENDDLYVVQRMNAVLRRGYAEFGFPITAALEEPR